MARARDGRTRGKSHERCNPRALILRPHASLLRAKAQAQSLPLSQPRSERTAASEETITTSRCDATAPRRRSARAPAHHDRMPPCRSASLLPTDATHLGKHGDSLVARREHIVKLLVTLCAPQVSRRRHEVARGREKIGRRLGDG